MPTETKPTTTTLARPADSPTLVQFRGTHTDASKTSELLALAQREFNLVSPAPAVAQIPDGCAVALAAVVIDPVNDTYQIPGGSKRGLGKAALDRIASAVGLRAVPEQCGRVDDGSHPYYVHYRWTGYYRHFDGTIVPVSGEKRMDLRDGSAMVENLRRIAEKTKRDPTNELSQMRAFIVEHAETKARLRAIRSLGIKTSYEPAELAKPFVAARLQITGNFSDAEVRKHYQKGLADSFIGASQALYGGAGSPHGQPAPTALPDAAPAHRLPPPPIDQTPSDPDDDLSAPAAEAPGRGDGVGGAPDGVVHSESALRLRLPKKGGGGPTVAEASWDDLQYWRGKIRPGVEEGTSKYLDKDTQLLRAIDEEIAARENPQTEAPPADGPALPKSPSIPKGRGLPGEGKTIREATPEELQGCIAAVSKIIDEGKLDAAQQTGAEKFRDACISSLNERELAARGDGGTQAEMFS